MRPTLSGARTYILTCWTVLLGKSFETSNSWATNYLIMLQTKDDNDMDLGMDMDFDLLDSDADKKSGQKRPRRRVIVETKDANGRAYSAAEIRRMKR